MLPLLPHGDRAQPRQAQRDAESHERLEEQMKPYIKPGVRTYQGIGCRPQERNRMRCPSTACEHFAALRRKDAVIQRIRRLIADKRLFVFFAKSADGKSVAADLDPRVVDTDRARRSRARRRRFLARGRHVRS